MPWAVGGAVGLAALMTMAPGAVRRAILGGGRFLFVGGFALALCDFDIRSRDWQRRRLHCGGPGRRRRIWRRIGIALGASGVRRVDCYAVRRCVRVWLG